MMKPFFQGKITKVQCYGAFSKGVIFAIFFIACSIVPAAEALDECRIIHFNPYTKDKVLENHVIRSMQVPNKDKCELRCYHEPNCVSYNYGPITSQSPLCELNDYNHLQASSGDLVSRQGHIYRHILHSCQDSPCLNNATCQAGFTSNGYRCICSPGYDGDRCEEDVDECSTGNYECPAYSNCQNTDGSYDCTCRAGYQKNGSVCVDLDECVENTHNCHPDATCINTDGDFQCECKNGFIGDGISCTSCAAPWTTFGESCYALFTAAKTWYNADSICKNDHNALLVKIESAEENDFIKREYLNNKDDYWIGLSDGVNEGVWIWADRTGLTGYVNWRSNQPTGDTNQDCVGIRKGPFNGYYNAEWHDDDCSTTKGFICEKK